MRSLSPLLATLVIISLNPFFAKVYANPKKPKTTSKAVSSLDRLAARCEKAKATFHPLGKKDVDRALGRLIEAADRLEERLALDGSNGKAWKKYLQWAKLQSQLDSEEPDAKVLQDIYTRFVRQYEGLELVWFLDLRDALAHYLAVAGAVDNPNLETFYQEQLDRLADAIRAYAEKPTGEQAQTIGRLLGWLENARQADALVAAVRRVFHRPNLRIMATEELVGAGISEPVDEETPIEDCILRTTLVGTGQTNGEIRVGPGRSGDCRQ